MTTPIKVVLTDDVDAHRTTLRMMLQRINPPVDIVAEFTSGQKLINGIASVSPQIIFSDIRMPDMDGLTALLHLRRVMKVKTPIVMVSSEEESNISRRAKKPVNPEALTMSLETKLGHMAKVEQRVLSGAQEDGKINDLLSGCEALALDPIAYAQHLGASGYITKPYNFEIVQKIMTAVLQGGGFAKA